MEEQKKKEEEEKKRKLEEEEKKKQEEEKKKPENIRKRVYDELCAISKNLYLVIFFKFGFDISVVCQITNLKITYLIN